MVTLEEHMDYITKYYATKIYELYDINALNIEKEFFKQHKARKYKISIDDFIKIRCKALDLILSTMYSICTSDDEENIDDLFNDFICLTQYDVEYERRVSEEDKIKRLGRSYIKSYAKLLIDYDVDYVVGLRGKTIARPKEIEKSRTNIYNSHYISSELIYLVTNYKNKICNIKELIISNSEQKQED